MTTWNISEAEHGTFLCHGNYCVARLNNTEPETLYRKIEAHDELVAALRRTLAQLELLTNGPGQVHDERQAIIEAHAALAKTEGAK